MAERLALVALDGSSVAEQALPWAKAFARDAGMTLLVVQLVPDGDGRPEHASVEREAAQHYIEGVLNDLRAAGIEATGQAEPSAQDVAASILARARESKTSLIIMATHGRTGIKRLVLGSVAGEVIVQATGNLLVVKATAEGEREPERRVRRILLPLDGSDLAEQALPVAIEYAKAFGATLDIVQVAPLAATLFAGAAEVYVPEGLDSQLEKAAEDYVSGIRTRVPSDVTSEAFVLRGAAAEGILDHAKETRADIVVMTTHGRAGVARWTLGSVADRVLRAGPMPVLLVRPTG